MSYPDDAGEYERLRDETPMAKMAREQKAHEDRVNAEIRKLHTSLPAHSSEIQLFTFAECREWGLRKNARRSFDPNEDGA